MPDDDSTVAGRRVGVLMLDTHFERFVGDIGNPDSFDFPVLYERVPTASARRIVLGDAGQWSAPFIAAGRRLVERGATEIVSSCGFLVLIQQPLAAALAPIPVVTSSLLLYRHLITLYRCPGILTIDAQALTASHLAAAGIPPDAPVAGIDPDSHFARTILDDRPARDFARCEADVINAAGNLRDSHPEVDALLLECTNMAPHAAALEREFGLRAFSMTSFLAGQPCLVC